MNLEDERSWVIRVTGVALCNGGHEAHQDSKPAGRKKGEKEVAVQFVEDNKPAPARRDFGGARRNQFPRRVHLRSPPIQAVAEAKSDVAAAIHNFICEISTKAFFSLAFVTPS
jgi:hypothetical protein